VKVDWSMLPELYKTKTKSQISRLLGVSFNAVKKRLKKLDTATSYKISTGTFEVLSVGEVPAVATSIDRCIDSI
jgi:hypothetical protein